jgi:hypothetical protein
MIRTALLVLAAAGATAAWRWDPARFWAAWVVWVLLLQSLALGALFLAGLEHLCGARWSVPLRRVPERIGTLLLPLAPAAVLGLGALPHLYPGHGGSAGKSLWLGPPFFSFRILGAAALGVLCVRLLTMPSLDLDATRDPRIPGRLRRNAAVFMALLALVATQAAFDWVGGLSPEWYSDLLGVYLAVAGMAAGFAATTLGVLDLLKAGRLPGVGPDHLQGLGGLMFGFSAFWAYLAYAQYLLMWYGNLPEEAAWYLHRLKDGWGAVGAGAAALRFGLPFALLLPAAAKRDPRRLRFAAWAILAGHFLDMTWLVGPALARGLLLGWPELAMAGLLGGGALAWCRKAHTLGADQPVGDPGLARGLEFRL